MIVIVFFNEIVGNQISSLLGISQSNVKRFNNVNYLLDTGDELTIHDLGKAVILKKESISHYQVI